MLVKPDGTAFILSAFDDVQWCPVLQARFFVDDLRALAVILGEEAVDAPELRGNYVVEEPELEAIRDRFGVSLDVDGLDCDDPTIFLFRPHSISTAPYLVHTGYELPLLLDGRKKLARMGAEFYPPNAFEGEDRFDRWVAAGALHKEVIDEPFEEPENGFLGLRTVYYTPPGEEWRIPAMRMVRRAAGLSGGWNKHFERLEGMLFGYTDEQNDWWIDIGISRGGFEGFALSCAVDHDGLEWLETAGHRALPPARQDHVTLWSFAKREDVDWNAILLREPQAVAVVKCNVDVREVMRLIDLPAGSPWTLPSTQIPILNRHLRGSVTVLARREEFPGTS